MQLQQAAELKRRATVLEAQGEQEAAIKRAQATVEAISMLSKALTRTRKPLKKFRLKF